MNQKTDLCTEIASYVLDSSYEKLSPEAIDGAKKSIIDILAVIQAASGMEPAVRALIDFVGESGGRPESSVFAFGGRVSAVMAAFANGAMAHCLDYDDQTPWGQHSASSLLPAVFAVAERRGEVSGKELITAVAIGQDLFNRFRRHVDWKKDWNFSTVMGVFCATAACCRLLGLSKERTTHALGIASMQSCGTMEVIYSVGSDLRAMYAGFPAKGAVMATLLADKGITGVPNVFDGRYGIFSMYFDSKFDRASFLEGLGKEYVGGLTLYKRWPAVGTAHSHMQATMELVREHDLAPEEIEEIRVFVGDYHEIMCEPLAVRRMPTTLVDAKFSLPFLVAVAAVRRDMSVADFTAQGLQDVTVLATAQKVVPVQDKSLNWDMDLPPGRVEIVTRDGRKWDRVGIKIPGSVVSPMSWDDIWRKFDECNAVGHIPRTAEQKAEIRQMAQHLEHEQNALLLLAAMA